MIVLKGGTMPSFSISENGRVLTNTDAILKK